MLKNSQTFFKNLESEHSKIFKICLSTFNIMHERVDIGLFVPICFELMLNPIRNCHQREIKH